MKSIIRPRVGVKRDLYRETEELRKRIENGETVNNIADVTHYDESATDIFDDNEQDMIIDKPTITTSDVIEAFYQYSGTLDEFAKELMAFMQQMGITDSDRSVMDGINQLRVATGQLPSTGTNVGSGKQLMDYICYINVDWRKALMWMLLLNFNQDIDIMRLVLQFSIKPIEEQLNWIFNLFRSINIFGWRPFAWLPIIQWYEDIIYWFALNEYQLMCTFMRFRAWMKIGTDIGGKEFLIQVVKNGNLRFTHVGWMSYEQRRVLAMLQMGYYWQCSVIGTVYSLAQIRSIVGPIVDTTFDMYTFSTRPLSD